MINYFSISKQVHVSAVLRQPLSGRIFRKCKKKEIIYL